MQLPTQVHVGSKPCKEKFEPVSNEHFNGGLSYHYAGFDKPLGGLWTSRVNEYGCDWLRYLYRMEYGHSSLIRDDAWQVTPKDDISIYVVDDMDDYDLLRWEYPAKNGRFVDWEAVAQDFDAVYVKDWTCMEAWDCETVVWLNWNAIKDVTVNNHASVRVRIAKEKLTHA